jgi:hypothetical protein
MLLTAWTSSGGINVLTAGKLSRKSRAAVDVRLCAMIRVMVSAKASVVNTEV